MTRVTSTDYTSPYRLPPVRWFNRVATLTRLSKVITPRFDADELIGAARKKNGLTDLGDEFDITPLRVLCESIEDEARLNPIGRAITRGRMLGVLQNRLGAEARFARHPEILARDAPLRSPIVIAGLQRTGTTMLHRLLSQDRGLRSIKSYEALNPLRPEGLRPGAPDPRLRDARMAEKGLAVLAPDFFAVHPVEAEAPEEEVMLLDYAFLSTVPEATLRVPSFSRWLEQQDQTPAYLYLRKLLKLLEFGQPEARRKKRWVLKTPHHLEWLETLLMVFPDAKVVHTHRDPLKTTASFCSMIAHGRGVFSDEVDPVEVGRDWGDKVLRMITRAMDARDVLPAEQFLDVSYYDLMRDPMSEVARIYAFAGRELTPGTRDQMLASRQVNRQNKHGRHVYSLEAFGLERGSFDARMARYRERFSIPHE